MDTSNSMIEQQPLRLNARRVSASSTARQFNAEPSMSFSRGDSQDGPPPALIQGCVRPWDPDYEGIPDVVDVVSTKEAYRWRYTFWGLKGRILPDFRPVLLALTNSAVWILIEQFHPAWTQGMNIGFQAISGLSFVMALLVSFRLRSAYSRWYEGRMSWATIGRVARDVAHMVASYLEPKADSVEAQLVVQNLYAMMIAFPILLKNCLRDESENKDWKELLYYLSPHVVKSVTSEDTPPEYRWLHSLQLMRTYLALARDMKLIAADGSLMHLLDDKVCALNAAAGACDRIRTTPLAYGYAIHIRTVLLMYMIFLPPLFISNGTTLGAHIIIMFVLSHALLTVDNLAVQVEMPFGFDILDLPLEIYCNQCARQVQLTLYSKAFKSVHSEIFRTKSLSKTQSERPASVAPIHA